MPPLVHHHERRLLWLAYAASAVVASVACGVVQHCNNFSIFRSAFYNLVAQRDLYVPHPEQHWDLFKYSPTFALLFAPFADAPFAVGLLGWNLLNVLLVYHAVHRLLPQREGTIALALLYPGLVATLDGTQSNGLVAATIVFAWLALEAPAAPGRWRAACAIAAGTLVKLFPLAALSFGFLHRRRVRFFAAFLLVFAVLVAAPLLVTSPATLWAQYQSWFSLERVDALDRGASVMRLLHHLLRFEGPNWPVQGVGTALLVAPLFRRVTRESSAARRDYLCSLLVYAVIFNHKAEQSSFVIALVGTVVWYAAGSDGLTRRTPWRAAVTIATIASTVPVFIAAVAPHVFGSYAQLPLLAAAACASLVWISIQANLLGLAELVTATKRRFTPMGAAGVAAEE